MKKIVGIDIAKLTFEASFLDGSGKARSKGYPNCSEGFDALLADAGRGCTFVMEATGPYYYALACFLHGQGCGVSVINPMVARRYCQMLMNRSKTDKADACALRKYGQSQPLTPWAPLGAGNMRIKNLYSNLRRLLRNQTSLSNQLESFRATGHLDGHTEALMQEEFRQGEERITQVEQMIERLVREGYPGLYDCIKTIPGIGSKSAMLLLVVCKGFDNFLNYRQVIAYISTSPKLFVSGTSVKGKSRICKLGMASVRSTLYMAAKSAARHNPACKALYERLRHKGKPYRVAMVAVINKLVKQVFAIAKSGVKFQPDFGAISN